MPNVSAHTSRRTVLASLDHTAANGLEFAAVDDSAAELETENKHLRAELEELRTRVRAFESSRWLKAHPRRLLRPLSPLTARGRATDGKSSQPSTQTADPLVSRFRDDVFARSTFTHQWFLGDVPRWEPLIRELEARSSALLEVGSFEGLSACYLLWRLPRATITCIDTFRGGTEHRGTDIDATQLEARFDANVAVVDASRARKLVGDSKRVLLDLAAEKRAFDLIYVDGSHLGLDVLVDAALAWQLLTVGGVLIFDDYGWTKLGDDPYVRPGAAIDGFLSVVSGRHEVIFSGYQVALRKVR